MVVAYPYNMRSCAVVVQSLYWYVEPWSACHVCVHLVEPALQASASSCHPSPVLLHSLHSDYFVSARTLLSLYVSSSLIPHMPHTPNTFETGTKLTSKRTLLSL
jgi:hypothetical protein